MAKTGGKKEEVKRIVTRRRLSQVAYAIVLLILLDHCAIEPANGQLEAIGAAMTVVPVTSILATAGLVGMKLAALSRLLKVLGYDQAYLANGGSGTAAEPIGLQHKYAYMFPYVPGLNISVKGEHNSQYESGRPAAPNSAAPPAAQQSKGETFEHATTRKTFPSMGLPGDYENQNKPFRGAETLRAIFKNAGITMLPNPIPSSKGNNNQQFGGQAPQNTFDTASQVTTPMYKPMPTQFANNAPAANSIPPSSSSSSSASLAIPLQPNVLLDQQTPPVNNVDHQQQTHPIIETQINQQQQQQSSSRFPAQPDQSGQQQQQFNQPPQTQLQSQQQQQQQQGQRTQVNTNDSHSNDNNSHPPANEPPKIIPPNDPPASQNNHQTQPIQPQHVVPTALVDMAALRHNQHPTPPSLSTPIAQPPPSTAETTTHQSQPWAGQPPMEPSFHPVPQHDLYYWKLLEQRKIDEENAHIAALHRAREREMKRLREMGVTSFDAYGKPLGDQLPLPKPQPTQLISGPINTGPLLPNEFSTNFPPPFFSSVADGSPPYNDELEQNELDLGNWGRRKRRDLSQETAPAAATIRQSQQSQPPVMEMVSLGDKVRVWARQDVPSPAPAAAAAAGGNSLKLSQGTFGMPASNIHHGMKRRRRRRRRRSLASKIMEAAPTLEATAGSSSLPAASIDRQ